MKKLNSVSGVLPGLAILAFFLGTGASGAGRRADRGHRQQRKSGR